MPSLTKRTIDALKIEDNELTLVFIEKSGDIKVQNSDMSKEILDEAWDYLGIAIANLIVTFDPDIIAPGGGFSRIGKVMFDAVKASAQKRCIEFMFNSVKIVPTGLKQDTGVMGAIALALVNSREK